MTNDEIIFRKIKSEDLSLEHAKLMLNMMDAASHDLPDKFSDAGNKEEKLEFKSIYKYHDLIDFQEMSEPQMLHRPQVNIKSLDELLDRDKEREKDGFPRKINVGRLIKPGKSGKDKIVIVPSTVEEKFFHDSSFKTEEEQGSGGSGDDEEGEVIGEQPVEAPGEEGGEGPGQGEGGQHEIESSAYDLGKILSEQFELPNLKDKGKKRSLTKYTYDLTDKHAGTGQLVDKNSTLRKIVKTNLTLDAGRDEKNKFRDKDGTIHPENSIFGPRDIIYRIVSKEQDYESQAMAFFLRDYSGSMAGKSTELVVAQHVLIYSWLMYQYATQVETCFILHDTKAKEVPDFYTYYNSKVAGGTQVSSAYRLVNEIVDKKSLARDYNIYVFHGTDGDDWDTDGKESLPELKKMLTYSNRVGITIAEHSRTATHSSEVEKYLKKSELLEKMKSLLRLDVMQEDADEPRLIEGIKHLISE